ELDEGGRADQLELQVAVDLLGLGQLVDLVAHPLPDRPRVQIEGAGLERVVGDDQLVATIARDGIAVGEGHRKPALFVERDGGLALAHCAPGCWPTSVWRVTLRAYGHSTRLRRPNTIKYPALPRMSTLGTAKMVVNNLRGQISLGTSKACSELQSLIQDLSTNRCFVSHFEISGAWRPCEETTRHAGPLRCRSAAS